MWMKRTHFLVALIFSLPLQILAAEILDTRKLDEQAVESVFAMYYNDVQNHSAYAAKYFSRRYLEDRIHSLVMVGHDANIYNIDAVRRNLYIGDLASGIGSASCFEKQCVFRAEPADTTKIIGLEFLFVEENSHWYIDMVTINAR